MRVSFIRAPFLALAVLFLVPTILAAQETESGTWEPLRFLAGQWIGKGSGTPGEASSGLTCFSFELGGRILERKNRAEFPPKPGETSGMVHEDLLIVYPQKGDPHFRAVYFDNEGHVIFYSVTVPTAGKAVFESEGTEGPRFRLVYTVGEKASLDVEFLVAPPGGGFRSYMKGRMFRSGTN